MVNEELELFIHRQGMKPVIATASPGDRLREVLIRMEVIKAGQDEFLIFVGESIEALGEPVDTKDGCDIHQPVDVELTVEVLELKRHRHVHLHKCRHVRVEVNFAGETKGRRFSPAATVGVVTQWARRKFDLDPAAAAEYVLQICKTHKQPRSDEHLGELVDFPTCSICFDLVKEVTPQG
jgi:hypothetical protein